jgi:hypothetical protein
VAFALALVTGCVARGGEVDPAGPAALSGSSERGLGWAMVSDFGALATEHSYNSSGGAIISSRIGDGYYRVDFVGLGDNPGGNIQVVSTEQNRRAFWFGLSSFHCILLDWENPGTAGGTLSIFVSCHRLGVPFNTPFIVVYARDYRTAGEVWWDDRPGAYLTSIDPYLDLDTPSTPPLALQWNPYGAASLVTRVGTGRYTVRLTGVTDGSGSVQLTALKDYDFFPRCTVGSWFSDGSDLYIDVACFDPGGHPANSAFSLLYHFNSFVVSFWNEGAYLFADYPSSPLYVPWRYYQGHSYGDELWIHRLGQGRYSATLPGMYEPGAKTTALVTAYNVFGGYCEVNRISSYGTFAYVEVWCYDAAGEPADGQFTLGFMNDRHVVM